jgi:hypothetical protein
MRRQSKRLGGRRDQSRFRGSSWDGRWSRERNSGAGWDRQNRPFPWGVRSCVDHEEGRAATAVYFSNHPQEEKVYGSNGMLGSAFKSFVTFNFMNFPEHIQIFHLRMCTLLGSVMFMCFVWFCEIFLS